MHNGIQIQSGINQSIGKKNGISAFIGTSYDDTSINALKMINAKNLSTEAKIQISKNIVSTELTNIFASTVNEPKPIYWADLIMDRYDGFRLIKDSKLIYAILSNELHKLAVNNRVKPDTIDNKVFTKLNNLAELISGIVGEN